jgi:uncharacterized protein (TIGR02453 family)
MFTQKMVSFFRGLEKNNRREWFTPRKEIFEQHVRHPMIAAATKVNDAIRRFAVDNAVADPAKSLYRIYRDTRFSKDKTPYKTHIGALFPRKGLPRHAGSGFYYGISHKWVQIAGGVYGPGPEELAALRKAIAADTATFLKLIRNPRITKSMGKLAGDKLARLPKGFEAYADTGAAEYLKMKQLYWYIELPVTLATSSKLVTEVASRFKLMAPAMRWMDDAIFAARNDGEEETPKRPDPMW